MLQNVMVTVFTISEVLREKQWGGGKISLTPFPPRLGLNTNVGSIAEAGPLC